jgi:hypothetical protein
MSSTPLSNSKPASQARDGKLFQMSENVRGVVIVVVGSVALVAIAYGAMIALTGPNGWATKMANTAVTEDVTLTSYGTAD